MGIPITPDDPIDGGTPTCATYMPDSLFVTVTLPTTDVLFGALPRLPFPAVNTWQAMLGGAFPLLCRINDQGPNDNIQIELPTVFEQFTFTDQNCDLPLTGTSPGGIVYLVEDDT